MTVAAKLSSYLQDQEAKYKLISHPHSEYSMETAEKAHVHGDALAKGVLVKDQAGLLLVVEHAIVSPTDLSRVNAAFFTVNGVVAVILGVAGIVDVLL